MKEKEIREVAECAVCHLPFGRTGITFWRVRLRRYGVDSKTIRQQDGLAAYMGSSVLAEVMGTNRDMANVIREVEVTVCELCSLKPCALIEMFPEESDEDEEESSR